MNYKTGEGYQVDGSPATMLKAIETEYRGYRFRSRLEARWAVFLDNVGLKWSYEREGYDLDGLWYLPDFWLPGVECEYDDAWLEIKGPELVEGDDGWVKASALAMASEKRVYVFDGDVRRYQWGKRFRLATVFEGDADRVEVDDVRWHECPICHRIEPSKDADDLSCCCVAIRSTTGATERASVAAMQARFGRNGQS